jgi:uncharacterized protein (TIGR02118 family)
MHKLVVLIRRPPDPEALERAWSESFVPLAERMPGLRRVTVGRTVGGPTRAPSVMLVHELYFDDLPALRQALLSPQGQDAGRALMESAGEHSELLFAEHLEMDLPGPPAAEAAA